jgi:hypothetical protein
MPVETTTKISGLWIDPATEVIHHLKKSEPGTIGQTMETLTEEVITKVNDVYSFVPPLHRNDTVTDCYTGKLKLLYFPSF